MNKLEKYLNEKRSKSITLNSKEVEKIIDNIEDVSNSIQSGDANGADVSLLNGVLEILENKK